MAEEHSCPNCKEFIKPDWMICPYCGHTQPGYQKIIRCRVCSRQVISALHTCPYCASHLEPKPFPVFQVSFATIIVAVLLYGATQWGAFVSNGAQQVALLINPPTPTFTPTATATFTPTFMPSATPTPTETATPTPTVTQTPVPPTATATPTQTPTNAPTAPPTATPTFTITPTPTPRFGKPIIIGPEDGAIFGREQELVLKWADMGPLGPNEFYAVRLVWQQDGQPAYGGTNVKENFWTVPPDAYWGLADEFTGREYEWYVYIEEVAPGGSGRQAGKPASEVSDTHSFLWQ